MKLKDTFMRIFGEESQPAKKEKPSPFKPREGFEELYDFLTGDKKQGKQPKLQK